MVFIPVHSSLGGTAALTLVASALAGPIGGGDDPSTATLITGLPFADSGDTSALTNQFDVVCPFSGSTSPDAWYRYVADGGTILDLSLCNSTYDTKAYVLDADFNTVACNEDACGGNFRSELVTPALTAGTYYIVVDSWSGDAGIYDLMLTAPPPCTTDCPAGSIDEAERCDESGQTNINGGCDGTAALLTEVMWGDTVCGRSWATGDARDEDWFRIADVPLPDERSATVTLTAGFPATLIVFATSSCDDVRIARRRNTLRCGETTAIGFTADFSEVYWFAVVPRNESLLPCPNAGESTNTYVISWV